MKIVENTLKINNWKKIEYRFLDISEHKNLSKMVQYSKRTYGCHFSYVTGPNYISFSFGENLGKNLGAIGQKTL